MPSVQEAFYELVPHIVDVDPNRDGEIRYADTRFVYFHTDMFAALFENMRDVAGPVIDEEIAGFGVQAGQDIAQRMDAEFKETGLLDILKLLVASRFDVGALKAIKPTDARSQIEKIFGYGRYVGWLGPATIETYDHGERCVITVENSFEAASHDTASGPVCRFVPSVLKGIMTHFWDVDQGTLRWEERTCAAAGDAVCRFEITRGEG